MEIDPNNLPDDAAALQQMLLRTLAQLDATEAQLATKKRERVDENQLFMFAAQVASTGQEPLPEPKPADLAEQERQCSPLTHATVPAGTAAARGTPLPATATTTSMLVFNNRGINASPLSIFGQAGGRLPPEILPPLCLSVDRAGRRRSF